MTLLLTTGFRFRTIWVHPTKIAQIKWIQATYRPPNPVIWPTQATKSSGSSSAPCPASQ